jgi:hypothetical protein
MADLIHEHHTHIRTPEGAAYVPRTYAARTADGVWEAWLRFQPLDHSGPVLETDRESSQATREAVASWAAGLESAYFEGAFARAHLVSR